MIKQFKTIDLIPNIPNQLEDAALIGGNVIPFVGAGASQLGGCPSWGSFADQCLDFLRRKGKLNYCEIEQLKPLTPRVKLSLAISLQDQDCQIDFGAMFPTTEEKGREIYTHIERIGKSFVTTNYDPWLKQIKNPEMLDGDERFLISERRVVYRSSEFTPALLNIENVVVHLHGHIDDPSSMIMTTDAYIKHYAIDHFSPENPLLTFLTHLFSNKTVLFIGYGLEELEILEYLFRKGIIGSQGIPRHFFLQGFFSNQLDLANHMYSYYQKLGVHLLPFQLDVAGWSQLTKVLEVFSSQIPAQPILSLERRAAMRGLLRDDQ